MTYLCAKPAKSLISALKMERFCAILTTLDGECQCYKEAVTVLQDLVHELFQSYSETGERCKHFELPEYSLKDPLLHFENASPQVFFSIIEDKLFPHLAEFSAKWYTGENLQEVLRLLAGPVEIESKTSNEYSKCHSVTEISERLHQLADSLPFKGEALVDVFWFICGRKDLQIRSHLNLFGALKRLQQWHNARVVVLCSSEGIKSSFLKSWERSLQLSIMQLSNIKPAQFIDPRETWRGSLAFFEGDSKLNLSGFNLCWDTYKTQTLHTAVKKHASLFPQRKDDIACSVREKIFIAPEITIHCKVERSSVPFHIFMPMKLKLNLNSSLNKLSARFVEWILSIRNRNIALVGSILLMTPNNKYFKKTNKESWIEFVRSQSDADPSLDFKLKDSCSSDRRLCLVCAENENQLNLFVLRPAEHFNGRLQNDLAVIHSTLHLLSDQEVGGPLVFPDISDSFWETEEYFNKIQLAKIQHEISNSTSETLSTNSFAEVSGEMLSEKWTYLKALRGKLKQSMTEEQLDVVKRDALLRHGTSELSLSPSKWPERACLVKMDPNARVENSSVNGGEENLSFLTTASSFNIKDILEKFRSDGMPVKTDLAPLPPLAKGSADRHVQVILTRDAEDIKRQLYPDALATFYHGKEYCLDERSSLSKDSKLVQLQYSLVKNETLSSYVQTDRKQPTRRCTKPRNETVTTLETTNKPARAKRSTPALGRLLKRKSPVVKKTVVAAKRKRETSTEEAKSEQTKEDKKRETRSERHKRRLRQVVVKTIEDSGIDPSHALYKRCTERLYSLCKSFLKDLCSSHGLNDEMKRLASSNVHQVIEFETNKVKRSEDET